MRQTRTFFLGLLFTSALCARESFDEYLFHEKNEKTGAPVQPWFTGPILTPSGHVIPEAHQNYEPYVYWTQVNGKYDDHWKSHSKPTFNNVLYQMTMQFGVLPNTEFDAAPQFVYNKTKGEHMWRVSDIPLTLAYQLLYDQEGKWYPAIKLRIGATLPLGKYDHLNPAKFGTDAGGFGTWDPGMGVVLARLHHITGLQFLSWRLFFNYTFGTPVNVKGVSAFGGAPTIPGIKGTRGTVYPSNSFLFLGGFEYSLTQNWALALDIQYQYFNKRRFSGHTPPGTKPTAPSREYFALAPAMEYNWSANVGLIAGPWFSIAGRNVDDFISYVIAINIYN